MERRANERLLCGENDSMEAEKLSISGQRTQIYLMPIFQAGYADRGLAAGSSSGTPWAWCPRRPTFRLLTRYIMSHPWAGRRAGPHYASLNYFLYNLTNLRLSPAK